MNNDVDVDVDAVDYSILTCLCETETAWKKRVYQWIDAHLDELPQDSLVSVQTIGRRIDRLAENDLLETCIMSPDAISRDLTVGYALTDRGKHVREQKQAAYMNTAILEYSEQLLTGNGTVTLDREAFEALICDRFDIDDTVRNDVLSGLDMDQMAGIVTVHVFVDRLNNTFDPEQEELFNQLLAQTPDFREPLTEDSTLSRIRTGMLQNNEHRIT